MHGKRHCKWLFFYKKRAWPLAFASWLCDDQVVGIRTQATVPGFTQCCW